MRLSRRRSYRVLAYSRGRAGFKTLFIPMPGLLCEVPTLDASDTRMNMAGKDILEEVVDALRRLGLVEPDEAPALVPLTGGVSSEIWKVSTRRGEFCAKRALARLKVAAVWEAPPERSHYEAEWMRVAGAIRPDNVPEVIAEDPVTHLLVMPFLPPSEYTLWKTELRDGRAAPDFAAAVGTALAAIHAATAGDPAMASRFPTDASFHALRLEPYLEATAARHPSVAARLFALSRATAAVKRCLVHGDVSPKNILAGPKGPVFLDAECAWFGDPAFDVAFVLNHLLLKCVWTPPASEAFLACFAALSQAYLAGVPRREADAIERRVAALLPGLMLARIDGKSPVEYITAERDRDRVRRFAIPLLAAPASRLAGIAGRWREAVGTSP